MRRAELRQLTGAVPDLEALTTVELDAYRRELAGRADRLVRRQRYARGARIPRSQGRRHPGRGLGGYSAEREAQIATLRAEYDRVLAALLARGWS